MAQRLQTRFTSTRPASIVVTTYGCDTRYTQLCLERIAGWKRRHHELIVVVHDQTPLLDRYLRYLLSCGVINTLLFAPAGHGHLRGVNLGFESVSNDFVFNINTDVRVGAGVIDDCTERFIHQPETGMIGWHYNWSPEHEGTFWRGSSLEYTIRLREGPVRNRGFVDREYIERIRDSRWFTGEVFRAVGDRRILCADTSFFGIRKSLWREIGGFGAGGHGHHWADDLLCYGVLDQGYNLVNLADDIRCSQQPGKFVCLSDYKYEGIPEPDRNADRLDFSEDLDQRRGFLEWAISSGAKGSETELTLQKVT